MGTLWSFSFIFSFFLVNSFAFCFSGLVYLHLCCSFSARVVILFGFLLLFMDHLYYVMVYFSWVFRVSMSRHGLLLLFLIKICNLSVKTNRLYWLVNFFYFICLFASSMLVYILIRVWFLYVTSLVLSLSFDSRLRFWLLSCPFAFLDC